MLESRGLCTPRKSLSAVNVLQIKGKGIGDTSNEGCIEENMIYISASGIYGRCSNCKSEFPTLSSMLEHMDRLGISASVASNLEARDLHELEPNKKLLEDIENTPEARDRIIPAITVSPRNAYEPETLAWIKEQLASGRVGILAIHPFTCLFSLNQLDRLFGELAEYSPVVVVSDNDLRTSQAYRELGLVAERFPNMKFIVNDCMWKGFGNLCDIAWKHENIYLGNAQLHVIKTLETIRDYIGHNRALFSFGHKSIGGAPMAAIVYSSLEESEKEAAAGKTLLSLLPNRGEAERIWSAAREMEPLVKNNLWKEFIKGNGLQNVDIVDVHGHLGTQGEGWYIPEINPQNQFRDLKEDMDHCGVKGIILSELSAFMCDVYARNMAMAEKFIGQEEQFMGYFVCQPFYPEDYTEEKLEAAFATGKFVGIKLHPDCWQVAVTEEDYAPALNFADKYKLPVLIHSWDGMYDSAAQVGEVAARYPNAVFLIGHSGGGDLGRRQSVEAAKKLDNVYLEFSGSFMAKTCWEDTFSKVGADRIMFGTDTCGHNIAWELGRLLSCDIDDESLKKILAKNIRKVLSEIKINK